MWDDTFINRNWLYWFNNLFIKSKQIKCQTLEANLPKVSVVKTLTLVRKLFNLTGKLSRLPLSWRSFNGPLISSLVLTPGELFQLLVMHSKSIGQEHMPMDLLEIPPWLPLTWNVPPTPMPISAKISYQTTFSNKTMISIFNQSQLLKNSTLLSSIWDLDFWTSSHWASLVFSKELLS